jgi:hypothetical protein
VPVTFLTRVLAAALAVTVALSAAPGAPRIIAVSDVHGDYAVFVQVLQQVGVLDAKRKWKGGTAVLVQTGDVPDRGPQSRKVMDLLMDLEKQARKAGGQVHALLGNHEVMNMLGDLRYVSAEEYASYASPDSESVREQVFMASATPQQRDDVALKSTWLAAHPLGWVELVQAFGPKGKYGRWLRQHDTIAKVGDTLFLHGGISPKYATLQVADVNARIKAALVSATPDTEPLLTDEEGPLWYRGLALSPEDALTAHVDALLAHHGVSRIVLGHTVTPGVVLPRFGGKVILNDVGLSAVYGGPPSALEIQGAKVTVHHRGKPIAVPATPDLSAYLAQALSVEPAESKLRTWMAQGAVWPPPAASAPPVAP